MPPLRTVAPTKFLKTERSHEENQERAYIAASRRSDRSLEARVESARRASEIHKKRTGRGLRVTEQDVINEEMYEEEDDDLPTQYRRLTAHLQTGSADFNQRLSAYLTNHVAMRSALDQAINTSYAQQYPNAPNFAHNNHVFPQMPNFLSGPSEQQQQQQQFRHLGQPYPTPMSPSSRTQTSSSSEQRRDSQGRRSSAQHTQLPTPDADRQTPGRASSSHSQSAPYTNTEHTSAGQTQPDMGPFSLALPTESQQMLRGVLDSNHPLTSALLPDSGSMSHPPALPNTFSSSTLGLRGGSKDFNPLLGFGGMGQTLAPTAQDLQEARTVSDKEDQPAHDEGMHLTSFTDAESELHQLDSEHADLFHENNDFTFPPHSSQGSGTGTPGFETNWNTFIDEDAS